MIRASGWLGKRSQICFQLKESSTSLSQKHTLCFWRVQRYLKREVNPFLACWPFSGIGKKPRLWSIRSIHPEDHHCSKEFEHFYTCTCTGVVLGQIEIVCGQSATCLVENLRCRSCSKDPFLAPVTAPLMDRCNFPLPPLSLYIYCPQYQYREMCKSDIWSYYALSFYMKEEQLQQELCHQYEQEFKPYVVVENGH